MQRKNSVLVVLAGMLALTTLGTWLSRARGAAVPSVGAVDSMGVGRGHGAMTEASSRPEAASRLPASRPDTALLTRAARISTEEICGRVIAQDTKLPLAGAEVQVQLRDGDQFWNLDLEYSERTTVLARWYTDAEGRFRAPVQRALRHRLRFEVRGYAPRIVTACVGGDEVTLELARGASIDGVVKSCGVPLADVPIRVSLSGEAVELASSRTDANGSFHLVGLSAGSVWVRVESPLHEEVQERVTLLPDHVHNIAIDVPMGTTLHGRVVDAVTRTPIVGAEVSDTQSFRRAARTSADGAFKLAGRDRGDHGALYFRATGYARSTQGVWAGDTTPVEFALVRGGGVRGRCVDVAGVPLAGAYVAVCARFIDYPIHWHTEWIPAAVGGDGRFHAEGGSSGSRVGECRVLGRWPSISLRLASSGCPVGAVASSPRCRRPAGKARAALRLMSWSGRWRVTHLAGRPLASAPLPRWEALALPHPFPVQGAGATSCR